MTLSPHDPAPPQPWQQPSPTVVVQPPHRGLFVRALWYVFVGWWLAGILMFFAGIMIVSVVLLPFGLALVNRLPQVLTLRNRSLAATTTRDASGRDVVTFGNKPQRSMLVRAVYFVFVGWWVGLIVMVVAYLLCLTIVGLPLGLMLTNRLPTALTLRVN